MMNKWVLLILCSLAKISMESIVGVTYRDKFDFHERYSNPNHCNPFYWHPLHLPEDCAEIYSKAIRNKAIGPIRFVVKKPKIPSYPKYRPESIEETQTDDSDDNDNDSPIIGSQFEAALAEFQMEDLNERRKNPLSPYEQMMDNLREDISYLPTAPRVASIPGFGPVALYQQPVSKKSKNMILKIAKIYGKYNRRNQYYPYSHPQYETILKVEDGDGDSDNSSKGENSTVS